MLFSMRNDVMRMWRCLLPDMLVAAAAFYSVFRFNYLQFLHFYLSTVHCFIPTCIAK
jgi:hypothetical protein